MASSTTAALSANQTYKVDLSAIQSPTSRAIAAAFIAGAESRGQEIVQYLNPENAQDYYSAFPAGSGITEGIEEPDGEGAEPYEFPDEDSPRPLNFDRAQYRRVA